MFENKQMNKTFKQLAFGLLRIVTIISHESMQYRVSTMAQQLKVLVSKLDNPSSILGTYMVEGD